MNLLPPYSPTVWKAIGIAAGLILLIGGVLFVAKSCSDWRAERASTKARKEVNAALANLSNAQANLAKDKQDEAARIEDVKIATQNLANASNATEAAKNETNRALANLANVANANLPIGITADDLQKKLDALDR